MTDTVTAGSAIKRLVIFIVVVLMLVIGIVSPVRAVTYYATYKLNGGTAIQSNQTYSASVTDTSGVWATNSGALTLNSCTITTTGNSSDVNSSSQYGLNAGVLATAAGTINLSGGSVTTSGSGANGLFATGSGSSITMSNGTITATGGNAHGVDVTYTRLDNPQQCECQHFGSQFIRSGDGFRRWNSECHGRYDNRLQYRVWEPFGRHLFNGRHFGYRRYGCLTGRLRRSDRRGQFHILDEYRLVGNRRRDKIVENRARQRNRYSND